MHGHYTIRQASFLSFYSPLLVSCRARADNAPLKVSAIRALQFFFFSFPSFFLFFFRITYCLLGFRAKRNEPKSRFTEGYATTRHAKRRRLRCASRRDRRRARKIDVGKEGADGISSQIYTDIRVRN